MKNRRAQNHLPVNLVVGTVAFNSIVGLVGLLILSYYKIDVNDAVIAIISGMCGSLGTLLTTTRGETMGTPAEPLQAEIVNKPNEPVPVETTPAAPDNAPDELAGLPPAVDDGGEDLTDDSTAGGKM